jgi:hypothetical protein
MNRVGEGGWDHMESPFSTGSIYEPVPKVQPWSTPSDISAELLSYRFLTRTGTKAPQEPVQMLLVGLGARTGINAPFSTGSLGNRY